MLRVVGACHCTSYIIVVLVFDIYHCLLLFLIIYSSMLFIVFRLLHYFVVVFFPSGRFCIVSLLLAIFSSLSPSSLYLNLLHLSRGSFENKLSSFTR